MKGAALASGLLLVPGVAKLAAQTPYNLEIRGGIVAPAGDLADATSLGGSLGVGVGYWVNQWVGVRVDGDVDILPGETVQGGIMPDMTLWHYNAGLEVRALKPGTTPWTLLFNVGAGATTLDTDAFPGAGPDGDVTQTYFALNGGVKLGYDVNPTVNVWVGSQMYVTFTDDADLVTLAALSPSVSPFTTAWSFPITAGIRFNL